MSPTEYVRQLESEIERLKRELAEAIQRESAAFAQGGWDYHEVEKLRKRAEAAEKRLAEIFAWAAACGIALPSAAGRERAGRTEASEPELPLLYDTQLDEMQRHIKSGYLLSTTQGLALIHDLRLARKNAAPTAHETEGPSDGELAERFGRTPEEVCADWKHANTPPQMIARVVGPAVPPPITLTQLPGPEGKPQHGDTTGNPFYVMPGKPGEK